MKLPKTLLDQHAACELGAATFDLEVGEEHWDTNALLARLKVLSAEGTLDRHKAIEYSMWIRDLRKREDIVLEYGDIEYYDQHMLVHGPDISYYDSYDLAVAAKNDIIATDESASVVIKQKVVEVNEGYTFWKTIQ